jgi:hypothetical protein
LWKGDRNQSRLPRYAGAWWTLTARDNLHAEQRYDERIARVLRHARRGRFAILIAKLHDRHELMGCCIEQHHIAAAGAYRRTESREKHSGRSIKVGSSRNSREQ